MNPLPSIERQAFLDSLSQYINIEADRQGILGLLLIEAIHFSQFNQYYGFRSGDQALELCFGQLMAISRMPDTVFRVGDHRFGFILPDLKNPAFISLAYNKVSSLLQQDLVANGNRIDLDFRIGVALNDVAEFSAEKTLLIAEESLHQAKSSQKSSSSLIQPESDTHAIQVIEKRFTEKLNANDFDLFYQPKVNLLSGKIDSAEASLRWQISEGKFVSPQVAVDIAEKTGQSLNLTKLVINNATRQIKDWNNQGLPMSVSVNVPAKLVQDPELFVVVEDSLAIWGIDERRLTLEITESAIIEDKKAGFDIISKLKQLGVGISIDDFGTGYSSLSYFKQTPANELKIDRSLVLNIRDDEQNQEIVKIIIKIARLFELTLVAEGIEDQQTYDYLKKLGCDYGQGNHMYKPLSAGEFYRLVRLQENA